MLDRCGVAEQTRFWQHIGLRMRQEDGGRVYPVSGMASSVLDALRFAADALNGIEAIMHKSIIIVNKTEITFLIFLHLSS